MKKIIITERELKETVRRVISEVVTNKSVMKKYYNIDTNPYSPKPITESSINRILNKHGKEGMAIISANRSNEKDETEKDRNETNRINKKNTRALIDDIKASGFGYIQVYGGYRGTDGVVDDYEPSFIVTAFNRDAEKQEIDKLYNFAIEMCGKYEQNSILFKAPNEAPNYYDKNGVKVNKSSSNNTIVNDLTQEFFTSLIKTQNIDNDNPERSKRFTYDIQFEGKSYGIYLNPGPTTYSERVRRRGGGELLV